MATQINCPYCGATTEVGEKSACAQCGKAVTVSAQRSVVPGPATPWWSLDVSPRSLLNGFLFIAFIAGCDAISVLIPLFLPTVQAVREEARRAQCVKNLTQIGVAMQAYQQAYGCFPPSFIPDRDGKPKHSWRVLILPFLGKHELHAKYRFDEPWNGPHNRELVGQMPSVFRCASTDRLQTGYAMLVGPQAISDGPTARRISDVKDGLANTILVAEAAKLGIVWLEPRDLDTKRMKFHIGITVANSQDDVCEEISSYHPGLAHVLFGDGSVRAISEQSPTPMVLKALTTIDGGEKVPAAWHSQR